MFSVSMQEDKTLFELSHSKISKPCLILIFSTIINGIADGFQESQTTTVVWRKAEWKHTEPEI